MNFSKFLTAVFASAVSISASATLIANPSNVSFPDTRVGSYGGTTTVVVQNMDSSDTNVFMSNTCDFDFSVSSSCGYLSSYQTCIINISFSPRRAGYNRCTINLNTTNGGFASIWVDGEGVNNLQDADLETDYEDAAE